MPQNMRPMPLCDSTEAVYFSAACPRCGDDGATWRHRTESYRRQHAVFCSACGLEVAWNPSSGTEVAI